MTKEFDERNAAKSRAKCAEMADAASTGKRVLTERERQILDMWPKFEDGEYVWFGDELVHKEQGHRFPVEVIEFMDDGWRACYQHDGVRDVFRPSERVERPVPEDSWERLEEDAAKRLCEYFGFDGRPCNDGEVCPAYDQGSCAA